MRLTGTSAPEQDGEENKQPKNLPSISPELESRIMGSLNDSCYRDLSEFERSFEFENPGDTYRKHLVNIKSINQAISDAEKAYRDVKEIVINLHQEPAVQFWRNFWGKAQENCSKISGLLNYVSPAKREEYHKNLLVNFSRYSSMLEKSINQFDVATIDRKIAEKKKLLRDAGQVLEKYRAINLLLSQEAMRLKPEDSDERCRYLEDIDEVRKKMENAADAVIRYDREAGFEQQRADLLRFTRGKYSAYKSKIDRGMAAIRALYDKQEVAA